MAYFNSKQVRYTPRPIPPIPPYEPPEPPTPVVPEEGSIPSVPRPVFSESTKLHLFQTASENNKLDKVLQNEIQMNITFKNDTSAFNPEIIVQTNVNLSQYNYAFIELTGRYYFIENVEMMNGNLFRILLSTDTLMSFKQYIKGLNGIISKTEDTNLINPDYDDGSYVNQEGTWRELKKFTGSFTDNPRTILITAGGH